MKKRQDLNELEMSAEIFPDQLELDENRPQEVVNEKSSSPNG